ncbi:MAG: Uma2 family endonuclease, partial [Chloroflexi bacterium]|nr:Uma2 family endonuclease [Chloroflexota bacterium]
QGVQPDFETFEAFLAWVDEDTSAEWDGGEVVFMSPASTRHQLIVGFLHTILQIYVQKHHLGTLLNAPFKMKLPGYGPEPDIIFIKHENVGRLQDTFLDGPADLVVEVVSPESVGRDRGKKFVAYEAAGIPEYWLIDHERQQAEFYLLDENGRYQHQRLDENGRYLSTTFSEFWLQVDWLWQNPLPSVIGVLQQLGVLP